MFCTKCGKTIDDSFEFCPYCGTKKFVEETPAEAEEPAKAPYEYAVPTVDSGEKKPFMPPDEEPVSPYEAFQPEKTADEPAPEVSAEEKPAPIPGFDLNAPAFEEPPMKKFHSGLGWSIFLTVVSSITCCVLAIITSIIGIVFASIAKSNNAKGNFAKARSRSRVSKAMNWTSFVLILLWVALIIFTVAYSYAALDVTDGKLEYSLSTETLEEILRGSGMSQEEIDRLLDEFNYNFSFDFIDPSANDILERIMP